MTLFSESLGLEEKGVRQGSRDLEKWWPVQQDLMGRVKEKGWHSSGVRHSETRKEK